MANQNLEGQINLKLNDAPARAALSRFSSDYQRQFANIQKATNASKVTLDQLNAALGKGGSSDVAKKLNTQVALTKEEYDKVRKAIQAVLREQEKLNAAQERANKRSTDNKQRAQDRADVTTEAVKKRKEFEEGEKRITATLRAQLRERERAVRAYETAIQRSMKLSQEMQNKVTAAIGGTAAAQQRLAAIAGGATPHQALFQQLQPTMGFGTANWLAAGGRMPPGMGAGGGGFNWRQITGTLGFGGGGGAIGSLVSNALGGLGIGAGMYGVVNATKKTAELVQLANAYDRMEVAAKSLAGSQEQLNKLLESYQQAAGGAVDQATALESVLRLQATGFAKTAEEVQRFVRGARGASIALGKPQDYINQETQLAISNTSVKRLDQIGLGMEEVNQRVEQLRSANAGLTREMAFGEAVIDLLNEKYGGLSDTLEGQATGLERLETAWKDLQLEIGQQAQESVNEGANWLANWIKIFDAWIEARAEAAAKMREFLGEGYNLPFNNTLFKRMTGQQVFEPHWRSGPGADMNGSRSFAPPPRFDEDQMAAIMDYNRARKQLEANLSQSLLQEHNNYVQQYRSVVDSFQTTMLREEEDFNRSRERQAAESARAMAEVQEDATRREAKAARDLADAFARLDRDFTRQQALMERDLSRSIENMQTERTQRLAEAEEDHSLRIEDSRQDSLDRLAEMQEDYDEKLLEAREDSGERLLEITDEFNKDRERAERAHNDTITLAAANLDAKGIWMENRRFEREQEEANKAHEDELAKERKRLEDFEEEADEEHQKAIEKEKARQADFEEEANAAYERQLEREAIQYARREDAERKSHQQRIDDAKEALEIQRQDMIDADERRREDAAQADEDRLADIQEAITAQQTAEDEDRRIRLERMESDHQKQLTEMANQHGLRIQQIKDQAKLERDQLDKEFADQLTLLGIYIDGYALQYDRLKGEAVDAFDEFMEHIKETLQKETDPTKPLPPKDNSSRISQLEEERRGWVTMRATAGEGTPLYNEAQKNIDRIDAELERLRGGGTAGVAMANINSPSPSIAGANVSNMASTIIIGNGAVQITALPGQSPAVLGDEFERRLLSVVKKISRTM